MLISQKISLASFSSEPRISKLSWEEFKANSGTLAFLANPQKVWAKFTREYQYTNVNWAGYIAKMTVNSNNHEHEDEHACLIFIKMIPDEFENGVSLVVTLNRELYDKHKIMLSNAKLGDKLSFNGTLMMLGTDRQIIHLHGIGVKLLGEHIDIPKEMAFYGRYGPMEEQP